ncbi:MAG: nucleoside triphosphate pyrophosphatase, partial [Candidatus Omnitrophota bacterium]
MRKLYLASDSKARKQLLNVLGVKFKVLPSRYKTEKITGKSYVEIVKTNALNKAKAAGSRIKQGVVIGADTIVVQDGKIFGKPKDLQAARKMLKTLSQRPQWLYTGIAVIDKDTGRIKVSYEKTKVYMDKLSDEEIEAYFSCVSPLDKAGSFDIQGKGAFFIRRIEGCFYNVVGLPLRKLYLMLKELNIRFFIFLFCVLHFTLCTFLLSGCSTEYNIVTGEEEAYFYSTDKEVQMGRSIAREVEKEYKFADDPLIQKR